MPVCRVNALVPFRTRLADDGLVHVRAWDTESGPLVLVAELDWPMLLPHGAAGYSGPGIFNYPHYALPAALEACGGKIGPDPDTVVRLPAPPSERFLRVVDPDDPQGWTPLDPGTIAARVGADQWPGPPPGQYVRTVVEAWIRDGALRGT